MNPIPESHSKYAADERPTEQLLAVALSRDMDQDNEEFWDPVRCLQFRLPRIADRIEALLQSPAAKSRHVAATVLGQNSVQEKWEVARCARSLLAALPIERELLPLGSILHALGHLKGPGTIEGLLPFAAQPEPEIRLAALFSLSGISDHRALSALIRLSNDPEPDIRNWATFGLGSQIDADSPAIRDALLARLQETDVEIRGEALSGLARRGDERVIPALIREIQNFGSAESPRMDLVLDTAGSVIDAADESGDNVWLPALRAIQALKIRDHARIEAIILRCTRAGL